MCLLADIVYWLRRCHDHRTGWTHRQYERWLHIKSKPVFLSLCDCVICPRWSRPSVRILLFDARYFILHMYSSRLSCPDDLLAQQYARCFMGNERGKFLSFHYKYINSFALKHNSYVIYRPTFFTIAGCYYLIISFWLLDIPFAVAPVNLISLTAFL